MIEVLAQRVSVHGAPRHLRSDNGPEFVATANPTRLNYGIFAHFPEGKISQERPPGVVPGTCDAEQRRAAKSGFLGGGWLLARLTSLARHESPFFGLSTGALAAHQLFAPRGPLPGRSGDNSTLLQGGDPVPRAPRPPSEKLGQKH